MVSSCEERTHPNKTTTPKTTPPTNPPNPRPDNRAAANRPPSQERKEACRAGICNARPGRRQTYNLRGNHSSFSSPSHKHVHNDLSTPGIWKPRPTQTTPGNQVTWSTRGKNKRRIARLVRLAVGEAAAQPMFFPAHHICRGYLRKQTVVSVQYSVTRESPASRSAKAPSVSSPESTTSFPK